jgi:hypothetical protein
MKLGRFIKVIEKWVFFKLLFANLTDSSGGKNHNCLTCHTCINGLNGLNSQTC